MTKYMSSMVVQNVMLVVHLPTRIPTNELASSKRIRRAKRTIMIPEIALRVLYLVGGRKERSGRANGLVSRNKNRASETSGMNENAPAIGQLYR